MKIHGANSLPRGDGIVKRNGTGFNGVGGFGPQGTGGFAREESGDGGYHGVGGC